MCAIAGVINFCKPVDERDIREVNQLLSAMQHRGPDHTATKVTPPRAVLGSNRLAITDHSNPEAHMPFSTHDGTVTLVFNGEIYNHRTLRTQLKTYPFRTNSDTEVIVAAYQKWGIQCLDHFEGMFAFCLYDSAKQVFHLAVDPSGQKPLYYLHNKEALVFSSEIEPLIYDPYRSKSWDYDGIAEIIALRFTVGEDTHIKEVKKVEAGHQIEVNTSRIVKSRYYTVPLGDQENDDIESICCELRTAVQDACSDVFNLEVPYGMLLSGGIDSSIVLSEATRSGIPMRSFSIGFEPFIGDSFGLSSTFDEFYYSRLMSARCNTKHSELRLNTSEYLTYLVRWIEIMGEPLGSNEAVCLCKLFEHAAQECRVVFCGSGPDEIFDGYKHGLELKSSGANARDVASAYYDSFLWLFDVDLTKLLPDQDVKNKTVKKFENFLSPYRSSTEDVCQLTQLINYHGRCVSYEYRQMDKISMAYGVEVRTPLADRRVTKAAFNFNPSLKNREGIEKWIFKEALRPLLPTEIVDRPKCAFPTPIELWFTAEYETMVEPILYDDSALSNLGLINKDYLRTIWKRDPNYRNIFLRLFILNGVLERQHSMLKNHV